MVSTGYLSPRPLLTALERLQSMDREVGPRGELLSVTSLRMGIELPAAETELLKANYMG